MNDYKHRHEIDYLSDDCTGAVAYKIIYIGEYSRNVYTSPFVFENTDDAYYAACIEISGK